MLPSAQTRTVRLEESNDIPVRVNVDVLAGRVRRQARHGPHLAEERRDEARAGREMDLADRDAEARRATLQRWVVAQREVRLGHADWQVAVAQFLVQLERLGGGRKFVNAASAIDSDRDRLDLLAQRDVVRIEQPEVRRP